MQQIIQNMKKKVHIATGRKKAVVLFLVCYVLLVMFDFCLIDKMDDSNFRDGIANFGNIFAWMKFWGENWSGRVIPQGILVLLLQLPDAGFHFCNAGMWAILLLYTWRNIDTSREIDWKIGIPATFLAIFVFIPVKVLDDSIFWKSANVVYLWGIAAVMVAIYPHIMLLKHRGGKNFRLYDRSSCMSICIRSGTVRSAYVGHYDLHYSCTASSWPAFETKHPGLDDCFLFFDDLFLSSAGEFCTGTCRGFGNL